MSSFRKILKNRLLLIGALIVLNGLSLFLDPLAQEQRSDRYVWVDGETVERATAIGISPSLLLLRKNNFWYVQRDGMDYPADQYAVQDFLSLLSARTSSPIVSTRAQAADDFGLSESGAGRIQLYGSSFSEVLADILIGDFDSSGSMVFMRKAQSAIIRKGTDAFDGYVRGSRGAWFDLRIFPADGKIGRDMGSVQRIILENGGERIDLLRDSRSGWIFGGAEAAGRFQQNAAPQGADGRDIESFLRNLYAARGEDMLAPESLYPEFKEAIGITLEYGDGSRQTLALYATENQERWSMKLSGSDIVYGISPWIADRLLDNLRNGTGARLPVGRSMADSPQD